MKKKFTPDQPIRALSWKQPFAELMLHGKIETRTWDTKYRGWVLICASKQPYSFSELVKISGEHQNSRIHEELINEFPRNLFKNAKFGKAIAIGRLIDSRPMAPEDENKCFVKYNPKLYCHIYEDVQAIEPFDWKGTQGWGRVGDDFIKKIKLKQYA